MRNLSIVVLGGTGFLGTRLAARLIKDGHQVTVLTRDAQQHKHLLVLPGLSLENCDVYQEAQLSERFRGKDVVINLIGILNERGFDQNVIETALAHQDEDAVRAVYNRAKYWPQRIKLLQDWADLLDQFKMISASRSVA